MTDQQELSCPKCGARIYFTDAQCVSCGARLDRGRLAASIEEVSVEAEDGPPPSPVRPMSPRGWLKAIPHLLILIVGSSLVVWYLVRQSGNCWLLLLLLVPLRHVLLHWLRAKQRRPALDWRQPLAAQQEVLTADDEVLRARQPSAVPGSGDEPQTEKAGARKSPGCFAAGVIGCLAGIATFALLAGIAANLAYFLEVEVGVGRCLAVVLALWGPVFALATTWTIPWEGRLAARVILWVVPLGLAWVFACLSGLGGSSEGVAEAFIGAFLGIVVGLLIMWTKGAPKGWQAGEARRSFVLFWRRAVPTRHSGLRVPARPARPPRHYTAAQKAMTGHKQDSNCP